jgi:hypothetical protein
MDLRRRFVFRGNAAAIGGRIVRPTDVVIDSSTASSLTVAGGRSKSQTGAMKFGQWVSFGSAATSAEGLFDDVKQQIELSFGRVAEETLTMSTVAHADVAGLSVGDKPKLTIKRLHATLVSKSPAASGEPAIGVGNETTIEGVSIGGCALTVTLAVPLFQRFDTQSKLLTAADDPQFVQKSGGHLLMKPAGRGKGAAPPSTRLVQSYGTTYATIVRSIKWAGDPYPGATIDQHVVSVPDFGKIFFGELLITDQSRRLTMLRLELGSPIGGFLACAEVENNGSWSN